MATMFICGAIIVCGLVECAYEGISEMRHVMRKGK